MKRFRRASGATLIMVVVTLSLGFAIVLMLGNRQVPSEPQLIPAQPRTTTTTPPRPLAWIHQLAPGEKPPQLILFSFDGVGSHKYWQQFMTTARSSGAHFSGWLSGVYLLEDGQAAQYTAPGHAPGRSAVGFGGDADEVRTRIDDLNQALDAGHEIGTHYNGHFCGEQKPGTAATWTSAQWNTEIDQVMTFVRNAKSKGLTLDPDQIKGGRTPCLQGVGHWNREPGASWPAMKAHGFTFDTSQTATGVQWPQNIAGIWEFPMPYVPISDLPTHSAVLMDYNIGYSIAATRYHTRVLTNPQVDAVLHDPGYYDHAKKVTYDTFTAVYQAALDGNRAPIVIGNHMNPWMGGGILDAIDQFMADACGKPDTHCATYSEAVTWLQLQDPTVLDTWRTKPPAIPRPTAGRDESGLASDEPGSSGAERPQESGQENGPGAGAGSAETLDPRSVGNW